MICLTFHTHSSCAIADTPKGFNFENETFSSPCDLINNPQGPFAVGLDMDDLDEEVADCKADVNETGDNSGACFIFEDVSELFTDVTGAAVDYDWRAALGCREFHGV